MLLIHFFVKKCRGSFSHLVRGFPSSFTMFAAGEGIRTLEPTKGQDLKSCAFDQALLPPRIN